MTGLALYFLVVTVGFLWVLMAILIVRIQHMERDFRSMADAVIALDQCLKRLRTQQRRPFMADNDA